MRGWNGLACAALMAMAAMAPAKVVTGQVEYKDGDTVLEGYIAYDDAVETARPGVLIVHQWTGISDQEMDTAKRLAKAGYVAFAADIYGAGVRPTSAEEAGKEAGKYRTKGDRADFRRRLNLGLDQLKSNKRVDPSQTAAIGYCFGGTGVLELARSGADLQGVVSFHGGLDSPNPADGNNIDCKVLVLHGADDPYQAEADFDAFIKEMQSSDIDWQLVMYGNAVHSFTDKDADSDGARYNENADKRSWRAMNDFFDNDLFGREWKKEIRGTADGMKDPQQWKKKASEAENAWKAGEKPAPKKKRKPAPKATEDSMMK